jgi:hypothetical protein
MRFAGSDEDSARHATLAQPMDAPLKPGAEALDIPAGMRLQDLKLRVQRADYVVDPALVAAAMLRHAVSQRRCWNPRAVCATPPASSLTSGGPSIAVPIQVSPATDCAAARSCGDTQTSSS